MTRWFACSVLGALLGVAAPAPAQGWKPEKPVEIIIGTSAGGPQDRAGRQVQRLLQDRKLVIPAITVVNKPGGGTAIALNYLNQHPGDAHYLMINATPMISNYLSGKSALSYTDFTPIAVLGVEYVCVAVRADSPLKSAREVIERLRKDPASLSVAIGTALGNATHTSFAHAMKIAGVDIRRMRAVVFNSGAESMTAVMGGHVDIAAGALSTVQPQLKAGRLRVLAIGSPRRFGAEFAEAPTWKELGVDSAFDLWRGLAGPRGLSAAQVAFWDDALGRMTRTEEWKKDLESHAIADIYKNSAETARHWKSEYDEVRAVFTELGLAVK